MPPALPTTLLPTPIRCPRCATPLATLAPGAVLSEVALQCPRCGQWVRAGAPAGPAGPGAAGGGFGRLLELGGVVLALLGALAMAGLGASLSAFEATTRLAGGRTPALTAMVVGWHLPWLLAGLVVACAAGAVGLGRRRHPAARWLLIAAVALPVVGAPIFLVAMYLPIFSLADAIR